MYWGNRETEAITSRYGCIKSIAQLSDGLERRSLIRRTSWLNRGVEDYSDEHFSQSIYLRLLELKKQTPELPKQERFLRPYSPRKKSVVEGDVNLTKKLKRDPKREKALEYFGVMHEVVKKQMKEAIKKANQIREFGKKLEMLTGNKRFLKRDFEKFQSAFPVGTSIKFCRLALSTWLQYSKPIENEFVAEDIWEKASKDNNKLRKGRLIEVLAERGSELESVILSSKKRPNLVPTNSVTVKARKSQFYWEFFK